MLRARKNTTGKNIKTQDISIKKRLKRIKNTDVSLFIKTQCSKGTDTRKRHVSHQRRTNTCKMSCSLFFGTLELILHVLVRR